MCAWLLASATCLAPRETSAREDPPEVLEVRRAFAACRESRKAPATVRLELIQVQKGDGNEWRWERPKTESARKDAYIQLSLFLTGRKVTAADLTRNSLSGDWTQKTDYCFRSDGTLAFVFADLKTFHGDVQVEDRLYFNPGGVKIRTLQYVYALYTGKRIEPEEGSFMAVPARIFLKASALIDEVGAANVFQ